MPSFDVVCEANMIEVKNAIEQSNKEISTRFDFKGSDARVEHKEHELTLYADDDFKLGQVKDVMVSKMAKRNVDVRFLDYGKIEKIGGDKVKQVVTVKKGVSGDLVRTRSTIRQEDMTIWRTPRPALSFWSCVRCTQGEFSCYGNKKPRY